MNGKTEECKGGGGVLIPKWCLSTLRTISSTCPNFQVKGWEKVLSEDFQLWLEYIHVPTFIFSLLLSIHLYKTSWKNFTVHQNNFLMVTIILILLKCMLYSVFYIVIQEVGCTEVYREISSWSYYDGVALPSSNTAVRSSSVSHSTKNKFST